MFRLPSNCANNRVYANSISSCKQTCSPSEFINYTQDDGSQPSPSEPTTTSSFSTDVFPLNLVPDRKIVVEYTYGNCQSFTTVEQEPVTAYQTHSKQLDSSSDNSSSDDVSSDNDDNDCCEDCCEDCREESRKYYCPYVVEQCKGSCADQIDLCDKYDRYDSTQQNSSLIDADLSAISTRISNILNKAVALESIMNSVINSSNTTPYDLKNEEIEQSEQPSDTNTDSSHQQDEDENDEDEEVSDTMEAFYTDYSENPVKYTIDGHIETDNSISGANFNVIYEGVPIVKLTNEDCCHNGLCFYEGEIVDHNEFRYDRVCGPDGIYCCRLDDIHNWLSYSYKPMVHMFDVSVDDDARACIYANKMKFNKVRLSNMRKISDYVISKLVAMAFNGSSLDEILKERDRYPKNYSPSNQMEEVYYVLLNRDIDMFSKIPLYDITENLSYFIADNDYNGYKKMMNMSLSTDVIRACLIKNVDNIRILSSVHYNQVMDDPTAQEFVKMLFELSVEVYMYIPDNLKTKEMTLRCLDVMQITDVASKVPETHINLPGVAEKVVPFNGELLRAVDFKNITYKMCVDAVSNCPRAIQYVPLVHLEQNLCDKCIDGEKLAYRFIPKIYRTDEMRNKIIASNIKDYMMQIANDLTHNNFMYMITNHPEMVGGLRGLDSCINVLNLFREYVAISDVFIDYIYMYGRDSIIPDDIALEIIERYKHFVCRSHEFKLKSVKIGVHFREYFPVSLLTVEEVEDLVRSRPNLIDELDNRYKSDKLYLLCMEIHGRKFSDIPDAYRTPYLISKVSELYLEQLKTLSEEDVDEQYKEEVENTQTSVPPSVEVKNKLSIEDLVD